MMTIGSSALDAAPGPLARPPGAFVLRDIPPELAQAPIDWARWYLTDEDDSGQSTEQSLIIQLFLQLAIELARERGWSDVLVCSDQFFAWRKDYPLVRVSPDVYLLDHPPAPPLPKMWETWRPGIHPPRFALEIVSDDWTKDYDDNPAKYAQLGTDELVIFDPEAVRSRSDRRVALQVYRRQPDGAFVRVDAGAGPTRSAELDAYLMVVDERRSVRLRLSRDADGKSLVATPQERAAAAEARAEREAHAREQLERQLRELQNRSRRSD